MSRIIANDHLWDEDEVAYKEARNLHDEVEENKAEFGSAAKQSEPAQLDNETFEFVKGLDADALKAELEKRKMPTDGEVKDLKMALAQKIQSEKDAG